MYAFLVRVIDF